MATPRSQIRVCLVRPLLLLSLPGCHLLLLLVPHRRGRTTVRTASDAQLLLLLLLLLHLNRPVYPEAVECGQKL